MGGGGSRGTVTEGVEISYLSGGAAFEDFQLSFANDDGVAGFDGFEPIEAIAEFRDVGEVIAFDYLLQRLHVRVLIQNRGVLRTR